MQATAPKVQGVLESAPDGRLHVAVGIMREGKCVLIQQRGAGKVCAGQWEFPGGKVESGESPLQALQRELKEELGINTQTARLLLRLPFDYTHARVWLEVFLVDSFTGEAVAQEGQQIRWCALAQIRQYDLLEAALPILDALESLGDETSK